MYTDSKYFVLDPSSMTVVQIDTPYKYLSGFFEYKGKLYAYGSTSNVDAKSLIMDLSDPYNPIDCSGALGFDSFNRFLINRAIVVGSDVIMVGQDSITDNNLIFASKNWKRNIKLLDEPREDLYSNFRYCTYDGTNLVIAVDNSHSQMRVKKYQLNY